jgi:hypothetical protein
MELHFRGKTYEGPHVEVNVTEGEVGGLYRGKPWQMHRLNEKYRHNSEKTLLTYRGIHYTKDPD